MSAPGTPFPLTSWRFWRAFALTMRPYLLFVSGASGLLGLALAPSLEGPKLVAAALPFFLAYGLGQAVTDTSQIDTDALSSPYRPLVRGDITPQQVFRVSFGGLVGVTLLYALLNPWAMVPAALAVAGIAMYTPFKRRWWGGPAWNSWVVAMLPLIGVLLGGGTPAQALSDGNVWLAIGSVYFSYAVFVLLGYFKDVEADRATGYDTMVVRFGRKTSIRVSALHATLALACSAVLIRDTIATVLTSARGLIGGILWLFGVAAIAAAHVRIGATTRDEEAYGAIALVVNGYVGLHLGEAVLLRPGFAFAAASIFPLSLLMLARRPEKTQI